MLQLIRPSRAILSPLIMGHSIDFISQKSGRGSHGESADSTQEPNSIYTDEEYMSLLAPGTPDPRFGNTVLHAFDRRCRSSTWYPNPPEHQQCIPPNSSLISSNETNGLMSAPTLQGDMGSQLCFEPDSYTPGGAVPAFVEVSPESANLNHPQQYLYLAPPYNDFSSISPSGLPWEMRDALSAVSI
jgi:hypothetical protein